MQKDPWLLTAEETLQDPHPTHHPLETLQSPSSLPMEERLQKDTHRPRPVADLWVFRFQLRVHDGHRLHVPSQERVVELSPGIVPERNVVTVEQLLDTLSDVVFPGGAGGNGGGGTGEGTCQGVCGRLGMQEEAGDLGSARAGVCKGTCHVQGKGGL